MAAAHPLRISLIQVSRVGDVADSRRERILAAAIADFGERGYAGARTASIAFRAGVSPRLITYYFGGKRGLLDELRRRWAAGQAEVSKANHDFPAAIGAWLEATWSEPDWARLMIPPGLPRALGRAADPPRPRRRRRPGDRLRPRPRQISPNRMV